VRGAISLALRTLNRGSIPATTSFINGSSIRLQNGPDYYLQNIINNYLEKKERVELSRIYRSTCEAFAENTSVKAVVKATGARVE